MKWDMEVDEVGGVLEKIWDLHDKLSDAIHSISRAYFLNSIKNSSRKTDDFRFRRKKDSSDDEPENKRGPGFVFMKEFRVDEDDAAVLEAKSLNAIRTALENLEDHFEFFHTVRAQQKAERDAAVASLEQSRIMLAMRLAEHHGKRYKVIEEAQALVGDVRDASQFDSSEHLYGSIPCEKFSPEKGKSSNAVVKFLLSGYAFVSKTLKMDHTVEIMGNAALLAISMLAFLHLNQIGHKMQEPPTFSRDSRKVYGSRGASSGDGQAELDVMFARG